MELLQEENRQLKERIKKLNEHLDAAMEALNEALENVHTLSTQVSILTEEKALRWMTPTPNPATASLDYEDQGSMTSEE